MTAALQTSRKIFEEIQSLSEKANYNDEVIRSLAVHIKTAGLWLMDLNPPEEKCHLAYKNYIDILTQIRDYIYELSEYGSFSKRYLEKTKDFERLYETCITKHDEVIREFKLSLNIAYDIPASQYLVEQMRTYANIALRKKGIEIPRSELEKIQLSSEWICDEEDDEPVVRGKEKQIKRQLYGTQEVAVKKIENENRDLVNRYAFFMSKLSHCNNIEKFYGILRINHDLYVVTEWAEEGNLEDVLQSDRELSWLRRLKISEQIANALEFIHRAEIYHHNVKSRNVLLDEHLNAKLTGFDSSRFNVQSTTSNDESISSLRWTAPEKLKKGSNFVPYSKKCDIYSFSIVLWEIGRREKPFKDIDDDLDVANCIMRGERPPIPMDAPSEYIELMKQGWSDNSSSRPIIQTMREKLHKLVRQYQNRGNATSLPHSSPSIIDTPIITNTGSQNHSPIPPLNDAIKLHSQKNYAEAFSLFQQHAEKSATAKFFCGYYLYHGMDGVCKNEDRAIVYLREAADAGKSEAQVLYAKVCLHGSTYDGENGIKYLKKAVKNNDRSALEMWAEILYDGRFEQDMNTDEAYKVWEKAASMGSTNAKRKLKELFPNFDS